eukprot:120883_1
MHSCKKQKTSNVQNGFAGICAGVLTKSTVQPLDFIRTRLQVHDVAQSEYQIIGTIKNILKNEGLLCVYRGLSANLLGSGTNWGIYFFSYENLKRYFIQSNITPKTSSINHFMAGYLSGICAITVTNPIWCIKTRLQIDPKYNGFIDCLRKICKEEGILTLYRGLGPAYILVLNPALQFTFYEKLKQIFIQLHLQYDSNTHSIDDVLGSTDFLAMGAMAKMLSSSTVYPMQLIRARLFQTEKVSVSNSNIAIQQNKYFGVHDCVKRIIVNEGISGFYKGLSVNLIKTVPCSALTFFFYENSLKLFKKMSEA